MNEGVLMILDRIKTNPEEFVGTRWNPIIDQYITVLTEDEAKAIKDELRALRRSEFTRAVMQEILKESTPTPLQELLKAKLAREPK
jgi:hypothetical protein